jgi:hypothetical protein
MENDRLHSFARAVAARQAQKTAVADDPESTAGAVDEALYLEVAKELGMTEEELVAARAEGELKKARARTLRSQSLVDEAIAELEDVIAFSPLDVDAQYLLADSLFLRAKHTKSDADVARARALAVDVVRLAPGHPEIRPLLAALQIHKTAEANKTWSTGTIAMAVGLVAVLVSGLAAAVMMLR